MALRMRWGLPVTCVLAVVALMALLPAFPLVSAGPDMSVVPSEVPSLSTKEIIASGVSKKVATELLVLLLYGAMRNFKPEMINLKRKWRARSIMRIARVWFKQLEEELAGNRRANKLAMRRIKDTFMCSVRCTANSMIDEPKENLELLLQRALVKLKTRLESVDAETAAKVGSIIESETWRRWESEENN